jgi:5'-nucleotidase
MTDSHRVYEEQGLDAYKNYQISREGEPLKEGFAFGLVTKLLALNNSLNDRPVEVILLSRNSADTGLRVFNSIQHYELDISRAAFTGGHYPYSYVAAATILPSKKRNSSSEVLKIAFDGDSVLFSDESEKIFKDSGLTAFSENERESADKPLDGGPFRPFLFSLQQIQQAFPNGKAPIRTCLVTARSAPAHERVIKTLRAWNIRIDESLFLGGLEKGEFLDAFDADVFFDDQRSHCESARNHVTTGHVPSGIAND